MHLHRRTPYTLKKSTFSRHFVSINIISPGHHFSSPSFFFFFLPSNACILFNFFRHLKRLIYPTIASWNSYSIWHKFSSQSFFFFLFCFALSDLYVGFLFSNFFRQLTKLPVNLGRHKFQHNFITLNSLVFVSLAYVFSVVFFWGGAGVVVSWFFCFLHLLKLTHQTENRRKTQNSKSLSLADLFGLSHLL